MRLFPTLTLAILIVIVMLRFRKPVGAAILCAGLAMWACADGAFLTLKSSLVETFTMSRTYDLIFSFYFVMCLEVELRKSGTLDGMVQALNRLFHSRRVTMATMPAFLGLLPSVGGALFSAPFVASASENMHASPARKATINYWFRHVFEAGSPTIPGMILAAAISGVALSNFVLHLLWFAFFFALVGWIVLLMPLKKDDVVDAQDISPKERRESMLHVGLALLPIAANIALMMLFKAPASVAMGVVVFMMIPIFRWLKRSIPLKSIFVESINAKLFLNVGCILYFISLLSQTGLLKEIVDTLNAAPLPQPVIMAVLSFIIGIMTGMSQAFIAIVMPIVAGIAPQNLDYAGLCMVFGLAGQMITPVHLCFTISVGYFKASFAETFRFVLIQLVLVLMIFSVYSYLTWSS